MRFLSRPATNHTLKNALAGVACGVLLLPSLAAAQARPETRAPQTRAPQAAQGIWVAPYIGFGVQSAYYDGVVQFSDGSSAFLTVDPGTSAVLGMQLGYRFNPKWTLQVNLSTSSPNAAYIEDLAPRPDKSLRTNQFEAGVLYDATSFRVGRNKAPLSIGGGLSLTSHSMKQFTWNGNAIRPSTTSLGAHGLAALEIPLAPKLNFRGQAKVSVTPLALGDLEKKIAAAEGGGVTASLDSKTSIAFQMLFGVSYRP
jgi:opacity protein-like surface antigen